MPELDELIAQIAADAALSVAGLDRRRYRRCPHGFDHPKPYRDSPHSCDGCWCEGERDRAEHGWEHDTTP